jgi:hypothetical protein
MVRNLQYVCILLIFASIFFVVPAAADFSKISTGGTVYVGEGGLDISEVLNGATQIGWWAPGASITASSPDQIYNVAPPTNFEASPVVFESRTGPWYRLNSNGTANGTAFIVEDPQLSLRAEDITLGNIDVTNAWVPTGDSVGFTIETNLEDLSQRSDGSSNIITLYVQSPDGAIYSHLAPSNSGSASQSIVNISVPSPDTNTGSIWDTGNPEYTAGTYTIWAECNLNHMYDNYGVTGKTISQQITLTDESQNPLISVNAPTTSPTVLPTTLPVLTSPTSTPQTTLPPSTQPTSVPTTAVPTATSAPTTVTHVPTTVVPVTTASTIPLPTYSGGFEYPLALVAGLAVFGLYSRFK